MTRDIQSCISHHIGTSGSEKLGLPAYIIWPKFLMTTNDHMERLWFGSDLHNNQPGLKDADDGSTHNNI
jgi:hypothetical protein